MVAALAVLLFSPALASADNLSINDFRGIWRGAELAAPTTGSSVPRTLQDLDMKILPLEDGRIEMAWYTSMPLNDADKNSDAMNATLLTFTPSDHPGVWHALSAWRDYSDEVAVWARLAGRTLTVYHMIVEANGAFRMNIYRRTLAGSKIVFEYTYLRDGKVQSVAVGDLLPETR